MPSENGAKKTCQACGAIGVPADSDLCKPCRIGQESGPQARKNYLSTIAKKGAEASRQSRTPGLEEAELGPLTSAADAMRWSRVIALALAAGKISSSRANALRGLLKEWRNARESHLTEEKMQALEDRIEELQSQGVV